MVDNLLHSWMVGKGVAGYSVMPCSTNIAAVAGGGDHHRIPSPPGSGQPAGAGGEMVRPSIRIHMGVDRSGSDVRPVAGVAASTGEARRGRAVCDCPPATGEDRKGCLPVRHLAPAPCSLTCWERPRHSARWHLATGTWHLAPGTWHLAPGT